MGRNVKRTGLNQTPQDYAPTKWSEYFDKEQVVNTELVILCLHGGGYSALTWALFAVNIIESIDCQVVAMDLRGHGNTKSNNEADLSLDTLAKYTKKRKEKLLKNVKSKCELLMHVELILTLTVEKISKMYFYSDSEVSSL